MWSPTGLELAMQRVLPGDPQLLGALLVARRRHGAEADHERRLPEHAAELVAGRLDDRLRAQVSSDAEIYVVRPDGTELHRVVATVHRLYSGRAGLVTGRLEDRVHERRQRRLSRYGPPPGQEVFVVDADGSNVRRLTELAPQLVASTCRRPGPRTATRSSSGAAAASGGTCDDEPRRHVRGGFAGQERRRGHPPGRSRAGRPPRRARRRAAPSRVEATAQLWATSRPSSSWRHGRERGDGGADESLRHVHRAAPRPRHHDYGSIVPSIPSGIRFRSDRLERRPGASRSQLLEPRGASAAISAAETFAAS